MSELASTKAIRAVREAALKEGVTPFICLAGFAEADKLVVTFLDNGVSQTKILTLEQASEAFNQWLLRRINGL